MKRLQGKAGKSWLETSKPSQPVSFLFLAPGFKSHSSCSSFSSAAMFGCCICTLGQDLLYTWCCSKAPARAWIKCLYTQAFWKFQFPSCKLLLPSYFCSDPTPPICLPPKPQFKLISPAPPVPSFAHQAQQQELLASTGSLSVLSFLLTVRGSSPRKGKPWHWGSALPHADGKGHVIEVTQ